MSSSRFQSNVLLLLFLIFIPFVFPADSEEGKGTTISTSPDQDLLGNQLKSGNSSNGNEESRYSKYLAERKQILDQLKELDISIGKKEPLGEDGAKAKGGRGESNEERGKGESKPVGAAASDEPFESEQWSHESATSSFHPISPPYFAYAQFPSQYYTTYNAYQQRQQPEMQQQYKWPYYNGEGGYGGYCPAQSYYSGYNPGGGGSWGMPYGGGMPWGGYGGGGNLFNLGLGWGFNLGLPGSGVGVGSGFGVNVGK